MFKKFKDNFANRYLPQLLADFIMLFSYDTIQKIGYYGGTLGFLVAKKTRERAVNQIKFHLNLNDADAKKLAKANMITLCQGVCEFCWTRRALREGIEKFIRLEDEATLHEIYSRGKGIMLFTAHMGNWEWMAALVHAKGYKIGAVGKRLTRPGLTQLIMALRAEFGMKVYARESNADLRTAVRDVAKEGYMLALLLDQDEGKHGFPVRFFNHVTSAPKGLAMFAKLTDAPILPVFAVKENGRYIIKIMPELVYDRDKLDELAQWKMTQTATSTIEDAIRKHPADWSWIQNRWKSIYKDEILAPIHNDVGSKLGKQ
ncbi:MAG: lysophospholipid acyltransferase family protein [Negativicutes bacterium]|jgi:KDO2-lipid IV(A) lauroyltransferase